MQRKTSTKPILKKNGIICNDCWQEQTEYACGHLQKITTPLQMCKAHRKLDAYFVDYEMRTTTLDQRCGVCAEKHEREEREWEERETERARREEEDAREEREREQRAVVEERQREAVRLRGLSDGDFEREMREVEERFIGKSSREAGETASPRSFWEARDKENLSGL